MDNIEQMNISQKETHKSIQLIKIVHNCQQAGENATIERQVNTSRSKCSLSRSLTQIPKRKRKKSITLVWLFFLFISTLMCVNMIARIINEYLQYEVITKIRVFNEKPTLFPTITICNKNPFITEHAHRFLTKYSFKVRHNISDSRNQTREINIMFTKLFESALSAMNPEFTDESRKSLGLTIDDMMIRCHFGEDKCDRDDFVWFYDFNYGNCYRFNSGFNSSGHAVPLRYVQKPGRFSGLYLQLFIGRPQRLYLSEFSSGVHVAIGNSTLKPRLSEGVSAQPGTITNIDIKRVFTQRLPKPYSECEEFESGNPLFGAFMAMNSSYRQNDCFDLCLQRTIINKCGCYDLQYFQLNNSSPCLNVTSIACIQRVSNDFNKKDISKFCAALCPLECNSVSFELSTSLASYPSRIYAELLKSRVHIKKFFNRDEHDELTFDKLKESVLALDINYSDLKYTLISESVSKTFIDLMASIGGTIGVLLGFNLLGFVKLIEKCVIKFDHFFCRNENT